MTPSHETDAVARRCTPTGVALPSQRTRGGNRNDVSTASCETRHSTAPRCEADRATGREPWASCPCSHRGRTSNLSMRWRASSRGLMSGHRGHAIRSKPMLQAAAPESTGVVTHRISTARAPSGDRGLLFLSQCVSKSPLEASKCGVAMLSMRPCKLCRRRSRRPRRSAPCTRSRSRSPT